MPGSPAIPGSRGAGSDDAGDRLAAVAIHALPPVVTRATLARLAGSVALACGAGLVLRRLAGAIEPPPGPGAVLAACVAGRVLVAFGGLASRAAGSAAPSLPSLLTRLGLMLAVTAVSRPMRSGTTPENLLTVLALLVSLAVALGGSTTRRIATRVLRRPAPMAEPPREQSAPIMPPSATMPPTPAAFPTPRLQADDRLETTGPPPHPAGSLLQRFERLALPGGAEHVRGRLSVVVAAGTRTGYAHVGFCPPLAALPAVEVTTEYDGVEAVVSAAEVLPWGVRVECRLDEPAEETIEIPVDIQATTST
ncbi:MAG: hypothetical protein ACKOHG_06275 [Planctomycetia bacterium]